MFDGCAPMNFIHRLQQTPRGRVGSFVLTTLAALVSPTAILHSFTGVTLLVGYMQSKTVQAMLQTTNKL